MNRDIGTLHGLKLGKTDLRPAVFIALSLVIIGIWVNLVGYTSVFVAPSITGNDSSIVRYAYHAGRIASALSMIVFFKSFEKHWLFCIMGVAGILCLGTSVFGFAGHQYLVDMTLLASAGSFVMGFGYICFVASSYIKLAQYSPIVVAISATALCQAVEQLGSVFLNFAIPETLQVLICPFLPLIAAALFLPVSKSKAPRKNETILKFAGAAKRHHILILLLANLSLTILSAISNVGLWGNERIDYMGDNFSSSMTDTFLACLIMVVLAYTTLVRAAHEPLSFRYQVPFLIVVAGFMLATLEQFYSDGRSTPETVIMLSLEFYLHVLMWSIAMAAVKDLSIPPYRIVGYGMGVYCFMCLAWIMLWENALPEMYAAIIVVSYLLILAIAVHPRILYKKSLPDLLTLEEMNEYIIEGEEEIPLESNGRVIEELMKRRCRLLSESYNLSSREEEVFCLLAQGRSRPAIQKELILSEGTVKTHSAHIYDKLRVNSNQELLDIVYGKPRIQ